MIYIQHTFRHALHALSNKFLKKKEKERKEKKNSPAKIKIHLKEDWKLKFSAEASNKSLGK